MSHELIAMTAASSFPASVHATALHEFVGQWVAYVERDYAVTHAHDVSLWKSSYLSQADEVVCLAPRDARGAPLVIGYARWGVVLVIGHWHAEWFPRGDSPPGPPEFLDCMFDELHELFDAAVSGRVIESFDGHFVTFETWSAQRRASSRASMAVLPEKLNDIGPVGTVVWKPWQRLEGSAAVAPR